MNISDLKDSELITELYERMTAPKESNIDRIIRESFERIDNIIELACDDLDELKKDYDISPLRGLGARGQLFSSRDSEALSLAAAQQNRASDSQLRAIGGMYAGLGMASGLLFR